MPKSVSSEEPKSERKVGLNNLSWHEAKVGPSSSPRFGADVNATVPLKQGYAVGLLNCRTGQLLKFGGSSNPGCTNLQPNGARKNGQRNTAGHR
ncbi:hypothetical protein L3X38_040056 [Prunus dulcis]|uniref:Uncharacterized protein n=1 Tax=Prunus dulcis TaxID=3755 RepID=A0AAD4YTQ2_PRUDU|nr:hypothetical protein L3X38_040056 [Prunus dulcis]